MRVAGKRESERGRRGTRAQNRRAVDGLIPHHNQIPHSLAMADRPEFGRGESSSLDLSLSRVDSRESAATRQGSLSASSFDLAAFQQYLSSLLPLVLGAEEHHLDDLFHSPEFADRATKWASDPSVPVVYVVKTRDEPDERDTGQLYPFVRPWKQS